MARVRDGDHPGRPGYRLLISRAGDWTGPLHRRSAVARLGPRRAGRGAHGQGRPLYERVVYVVTGSGIGPCLGQILAARVPARLVWSTRDPRATYGDALVDEVEAAQPDAVIWDTTERGKPDLAAAGPAGVPRLRRRGGLRGQQQGHTLRLVHELERRGIPAFGPIWDS